jgi:hypothetical protein
MQEHQSAINKPAKSSAVSKDPLIGQRKKGRRRRSAEWIYWQGSQFCFLQRTHEQAAMIIRPVQGKKSKQKLPSQEVAKEGKKFGRLRVNMVKRKEKRKRNRSARNCCGPDTFVD